MSKFVYHTHSKNITSHKTRYVVFRSDNKMAVNGFSMKKNDPIHVKFMYQNNKLQYMSDQTLLSVLRYREHFNTNVKSRQRIVYCDGKVLNMDDAILKRNNYGYNCFECERSHIVNTSNFNYSNMLCSDCKCKYSKLRNDKTKFDRLKVYSNRFLLEVSKWIEDLDNKISDNIL